MRIRRRAFATASLGATAVVAADWPQFLGPRRNGISDESGLVDSLSTATAPILWRRVVGGGYAGPLVVGDRILVFHFKEGNEVVEAFRVRDGQSLWSTGYPCDYDGGMFRERGPRATPTVVDDAIVSFGSDGVLQCLGLTDGRIRWRKALHKEFEVPESFFGVACSPLVAEGRVLVNLGGRDGAGICAFRLADGRLAWKATHETASYSSPVLAKLSTGPTALFFARSGLVGVAPQSGELRFSFPMRARIDASVNAATPLAWDDHVLLTASYGVGAALLNCSASPPRVAWRSDELSGHFNSPVKVGGDIYGIDGRQEGGDARLVCLEAATGKLRWAESGIGCASIVSAEGKLFALRENGELLLCRAAPAKFQSLGRMSVAKGLCRAAPALANGRMYLRSERELVCVDLRKTQDSRTH